MAPPIEFKAVRGADGKLDVKAVVERRGNDVIVHVPSFNEIARLTREEKRTVKALRQDGKRDLQ